jgi:hypothetical protein
LNQKSDSSDETSRGWNSEPQNIEGWFRSRSAHAAQAPALAPRVAQSFSLKQTEYLPSTFDLPARP